MMSSRRAAAIILKLLGGVFGLRCQHAHTNTHKHTRIHTYIYIYICMYTAGEREREKKNRSCHKLPLRGECRCQSRQMLPGARASTGTARCSGQVAPTTETLLSRSLALARWRALATAWHLHFCQVEPAQARTCLKPRHPNPKP